MATKELGEAKAGKMIKRLRAWWPWPVLVLCGLPIVVLGAWNIYTGGTVRELVLEVDSENTVPVKARRRWVVEEYGPFPLAIYEDERLNAAVRNLAREAERDDMHLPKLPVRIVLAEGRTADDVWRLLVVTMRNSLWEATLEAQGFTVAFRLPKDESGVGLPAIPKQLVCTLVVPERDGEHWRLARYEQTESLREGEFVFNNLHKCADVGGCGAEDWNEFTGKLKRSEQETFATVEDADFSKLDVVAIRWGPAAKAVDLVRAIAVIRAHDPAPKVILVMPER